MIRNLSPDVVALDIEMPRMDGLDFLEKLMRLRPMPVVMISTLTERGSEATLRALELGEVDFIPKPRIGIASGIRGICGSDHGEDTGGRCRAASARVRDVTPKPRVPAAAPARIGSTEKVIVIGASTGGTEAIKEVLVELPFDAGGVLVTQHMPEAFTRSFATRLDSLCRITVKEAVCGERVLPGHAYIAPGHSHLLLKRNGANYVTQLSQADPVNRHRPSVDVLFRSAAECAAKNAVAIILTGMGEDGAAGMLELHRAGAYTYAQDEHSCVVFGMPKEAIAVGGGDEVLPLHDIPHALLSRLTAGGARTNRV